jgi:hypothetical protein
MMRGVKRFALLWLGLTVAVVWSCGEDVVAPGVCPEYCPSRRVQMIDSVFPGSIVRDSSFSGYVPGHAAPALPVVTQGSSVESRAVMRFLPFADSINDEPIVSLDSLQLDVQMQRRAATAGLELVVYRLPATVDSGVTFAGLEPFFQDSALIGSVTIPDTVEDGTVSARLVDGAFPTLEQDSGVAAVGVALRAAGEGYVDLGTREGLQGSILVRYATVLRDTVIIIDSTGTDTTIVTDRLVATSDGRQPAMDTYAAQALPAADPDALPVGGTPSARALLRVHLPSNVVDSADVSRATLILVLAEPVAGAPGDTLRLRADGVSIDVGAKSPLLAFSDTSSIGAADVAVGRTDTVRIDVTHIINPLRVDTLLPASIVLRIVPEGGTVGQPRFWSSRNAAAPSLHVTYIPLFPTGVQ